MGLAALARGERRMMPLGMVPYLLWPTRTALQARRRDRLARDLRHHLLCTVGVLYACGTTRATPRGALRRGGGGAARPCPRARGRPAPIYVLYCIPTEARPYTPTVPYTAKPLYSLETENISDKSEITTKILPTPRIHHILRILPSARRHLHETETANNRNSSPRQ